VSGGTGAPPPQRRPAACEKGERCLGPRSARHNLSHSPAAEIFESLVLHKGPSPVNAIGQKIRLTSGSISIAIDRLEEKGLVERKDDPQDRRARIVHLTAQGRKLIECAFNEHAAAMEHATSGLTGTERATAIRLLKKLGNQAAKLQPKRSAA
jgi:DNA-binding MarR family transcriptional regulator